MELREVEELPPSGGPHGRARTGAADLVRAFGANGMKVARVEDLPVPPDATWRDDPKAVAEYAAEALRQAIKRNGLRESVMVRIRGPEVYLVRRGGEVGG